MLGRLLQAPRVRPEALAEETQKEKHIPCQAWPQWGKGVVTRLRDLGSQRHPGWAASGQATLSLSLYCAHLQNGFLVNQ